MKVGVTILTGALGAGKSTLIKHLLINNDGIKIGVVINEVGDNSQEIDQTLAEGHLEDGDFKLDLLDLPSGCVCCTVRGQTLASLEQLVQRRELDIILLETTGIADPGPIANDLWADENLESSIYLDSIVTMVDTIHFQKHNKLGNDIVYKQISYANTVIINKFDEGIDLTNTIKSINPECTLLCTNQSKVDIRSIINKHCFDKIDFKLQHFDSNHLNDYSIKNILIDFNINKSNFEDWLRNLLWEQHDYEVYRVKGYLSFQNEENKVGLQGIMENFEFFPLTTPNDNKSHMIIIGKQLPQIDTDLFK